MAGRVRTISYIGAVKGLWKLALDSWTGGRRKLGIDRSKVSGEDMVGINGRVERRVDEVDHGGGEKREGWL